MLAALFATYKKLPLGETAKAEGLLVNDPEVSVGVVPIEVSEPEPILKAAMSPDCSSAANRNWPDGSTAKATGLMPVLHCGAEQETAVRVLSEFRV